MKFITILFVALLSSQAFAGCENMVPFGKPVVTVTEKVTYLCRRMYVLEHSPSRKTAYWSAEHLIGSQQTFKGDRKNAFKTDPDLPKSEAAKPSDYTGTGYDRGHMSPVGDMYADPKAMLESFYMSNMVPQIPENNENGWRLLEQFVKELSQARGELYVITGPIYFGSIKYIGKSKVAIPTYLYKIVYDPKTNATMSFIFPNKPITQNDIPNGITTLAKIEAGTHIKFFPNIKSPVVESTHIWTSKTN